MKRITLILSLCVLCLAAGAKDLVKSITWENICANPAPLPIVGQLQPHPSNLAEESWWSVGCETMDRDYAHFELFRQYVGQTGVGYARLQSGWAKCEQKKGKYDFKWLDAHVNGLIEEGVHPWMCLCYGNPIYSNHGHDLDAKIFDDGPIMDAWLAYVKAVVKRYKGKVTMYEIWNEPDNRKALDSYGLYANLCVRTAKVIREIDPDVKIAAFGSCSPDLKYIRQALAEMAKVEGGLDNVDYITYHAYWPIPETVIPYVQELQSDVAQCSDHIRLLQGETGCPGQLEFGHAMHTTEWSEYSQAKWDLRSMFIHWSLGCPHSVFTMTDLNYGWMVQSFGLIRANLKGEPVYLRPKFHAVQNVTSLLTADIKPSTEVTVESRCERDIKCVGLEKDGKVIGCALWFGDRRPSDTLEREKVALRIKDLHIDSKNTVYVDMLTGNIHTISELNRSRGIVHPDGFYFGELPLWDSPIVIIDKNYLK